MLPSVLINSVAISSIALGTERPSLRSGNHWKCCWQAGKESATINQPVRALSCQEIIQGWVFPLDFRFQNQCSSPAKGLPAPARAAMATARLRRTSDFLSTIFQTPIEIRAHSWWDGGYSRRRIRGWGGRRSSEGVRVSLLLGLVTPRIAPSTCIKKIYMAYSIQCAKLISFKCALYVRVVRVVSEHMRSKNWKPFRSSQEIGEAAKTSTHIHYFKILFSFQNCHKSKGE